MIIDTFLDQYRSSLVTCTKCRMCMTSNTEWKLVCPIKERFKFISYSSAGMLMIARGIMDGKLDWGPEIADVLYTCTMCNSCATQCRNIYYLTNEYFNVPYLVERMREELVNRGKIPPVVRDCLKSLELYGNPFNKPGTKRGAWAEGLGIPSYSGQEFLFYVGDVGSFDDRAIKSFPERWSPPDEKWYFHGDPWQRRNK